MARNAVMQASDLKRFWSKVAITTYDKCWLWTGSQQAGRRYGQFAFNGSWVRAPRLMWKVIHGEYPIGLYVCHRCDNPSCVNPEHLFAGTQDANMKDMVAKGRSLKNKRLGVTNSNAKQTLETVVQVRKLRDAGASFDELAQQFGLDRKYVVNLTNRNQLTWKAAWALV